MKKLILIASLSLSLCLVGCSSDGEPQVAPTPENSKIELNEEESAIAESSNAFGEQFFAEVCKENDGNIVVSPFSASMILSILANSTNDQAALENFYTLMETEDIQSLNELNKKVASQLPILDPDVNIEIANSLWYKQIFSVSDAYSSRMSDYYSMDQFPFVDLDDNLFTRINEWVSDHTNNFIKEIDVKGDFDTHLFINALYFKGLWEKPFKESETTIGKFAGKKTTSDVYMMHNDITARYYEDTQCQAIRLNFGNSAYYATIVLPDEHCDSKLAGKSDFAFDYAEVELSLPRLTDITTEKLELKPILRNMGLGSLLSTNNQCIYNEKINGFGYNVFQKATLKLNEEGAEAAAATWAGATISTMFPKAVMNVNRPFYIYISEAGSNLMLFAARVENL